MFPLALYTCAFVCMVLLFQNSIVRFMGINRACATLRLRQGVQTHGSHMYISSYAKKCTGSLCNSYPYDKFTIILQFSLKCAFLSVCL